MSKIYVRKCNHDVKAIREKVKHETYKEITDYLREVKMDTKEIAKRKNKTEQLVFDVADGIYHRLIMRLEE